MGKEDKDMKLLDRDKSRDEKLWFILFFSASVIFYFSFVFSVIPPQTGWWQYMAQRIHEGEALYKDVFMFVPPFFSYLTAALYSFFGTHMICYTLFGMVFFKFIPWIICYLIALRITTPRIAALSTFLGVIMNSSYLMDQVYDYNPFVLGLFLLQTYLLLRAFETKRPGCYLMLALANGVICGIQVSLKQNTGIMAPIITIVAFAAVGLSNRIPKKNILAAVCLNLLGLLCTVFLVLLPVILTNSFDAFVYCITVALDAKLGNNSLLYTALVNFIRIEYLISSFLLTAIFFLKQKRTPATDRLCTFAFILLVLILGYQHRSLLGSLVGYLAEIRLGYKVALAAVVLLIFGVTLAVHYSNRIRNNTLLCILTFGLFFGVAAATVICKHLNFEIASKILYGSNFSEIKREILYIILYFDIAVWLRSAYLCYAKKQEKERKFVLIYAVFLGFISVSFVSALLEELYALLLMPCFFEHMSRLVTGRPSTERNADSGDVTASSAAGSAVFNSYLVFCAYILMGAISCLCLIQKYLVPYEWHSWSTTPLLSDNTLVKCTVPGLEGFVLGESDNQTYAEICRLIEENSTKDDIVYQFPNIMLFNVLTERKSLYAAVPYFDVCPDSIAIENAGELKKSPPKLFIYANLTEGRWQIHEAYFRNGQRSGQREIQKFYNDVVRNTYSLLGCFDNNEGETIEVWCRND